MRIGVIVLATQKYINFVPPLYQSAKKHLLKGYDVRYFFLTDLPREECPAAVEMPDAIRLSAVHYPSFIGTMANRYRQVLAHEKQYDCDYLIHQDADMAYVSDVGEEIISPSVFATTSPNFPYGKWWATGSLLGGQRETFLQALRETQAMIDAGPIDQRFPEEEKWNIWLSTHEHMKLPVEYCTPDRPSRKGVDPKIVTLTTLDKLKKTNVHRSQDIKPVAFDAK